MFVSSSIVLLRMETNAFGARLIFEGIPLPRALQELAPATPADEPPAFGCLGFVGPVPQPILMSDDRLDAEIMDVKTFRRLYIQILQEKICKKGNFLSRVDGL